MILIPLSFSMTLLHLSWGPVSVLDWVTGFRIDTTEFWTEWSDCVPNWYNWVLDWVKWLGSETGPQLRQVCVCIAIYVGYFRWSRLCPDYHERATLRFSFFKRGLANLYDQQVSDLSLGLNTTYSWRLSDLV